MASPLQAGALRAGTTVRTLPHLRPPSYGRALTRTLTGRDLLQATARADSSAVAGPEGSASSNVKAGVRADGGRIANSETKALKEVALVRECRWPSATGPSPEDSAVGLLCGSCKETLHGC